MTATGASPLGVVDRDGQGTPASVWRAWEREFPPVDVTNWRHVVVVAPHPDDEVLGVAGLMTRLVDAGGRVNVIGVTDGAAACPPSGVAAGDLAALRVREATRGCAVLGVDPPVRLQLPDGHVSDHEARLSDLVEASLTPESICLATWAFDGHPDHEAVGRASAVAVTRAGCRLMFYPVWMWHWSHPDDPAVPWHKATAFALTPAEVVLKRLAVAFHRSQLDPPHPGGTAVLPPFVLDRLVTNREILLL